MPSAILTTKCTEYVRLRTGEPSAQRSKCRNESNGMCCLFCTLKCPNAGIVDSPVCLTGEYDEIFDRGGDLEDDSDDEYGPDDDDDYPCDLVCSDCYCNTCRIRHL